MNIGDASRQSGLPAKTIRYYEESGLIAPIRRNDAGYRDYSENDVHTLQFLKRARDLGFSVKDCATLLSLYRDRNRSSADVKAVARQHIDRIRHKIAELEQMDATLTQLMERCHGDDRPDCPILGDLAKEP